MSEATLQGFTREFLHSLFDYDPETGVVRWKVSLSRRALVGAVVKGATKAGYLRVSVHKTSIYVHRLVWFLTTGRPPVALIDHRNGVPWDNRFDNLREATFAQNLQNTRKRRGARSTYQGVSSCRNTNRWRVQIHAEGHPQVVGYSDDEVHAALIYNAVAHALFGEFAHVNEIDGDTSDPIPRDCIDLFLCHVTPLAYTSLRSPATS